MISPVTIERINHATDIAEVVSDYVGLKRKGKDLTACCPFHDEKSPSFYVVPTKNIFYCFGCGKGGNAITFLMEHESMTYVEALKHLAHKYNIEIEEEIRSDHAHQQQAQQESIYAVLNFANDFFQKQLQGSGTALAYINERQLNADSIKTFQIGYNPVAWDALIHAAQAAGYKQEYLEKAGLIIVKDDGKTYDRYRSRIIFPILNLSGRVLGFAGRILTSDKSTAKYINSPETDVYHKSQVLYGLYQAKESIKKSDVCYLTEGYLDVITLHQAGVKNVVASSGTSLNIEQIKLISRFTQNLTILYDGDTAGISASLRGIDLILSQGINVRVVLFPQGHDPDSYLQKVGADKFEQYIKNAKDFITFKAEVLYQQAQHDPVQRGRMIQSVMESIAVVPNVFIKNSYIKEACRVLDVDEASAHAFISDKKYITHTAKADFIKPSFNTVLNNLREKKFIKLLINNGHMIVDSNKSLAELMLEDIEIESLTHESYNLILTEYRNCIKNKFIPNTDFFVNHENNAIRNTAAVLIAHRDGSKSWFKKYGYQNMVSSDLLFEEIYQTILAVKIFTLSKMIHENICADSQPEKLIYLKSKLSQLLRLSPAVCDPGELVFE